MTLMLVVIGAVAASAGILSPILTYRISAKAGSAQVYSCFPTRPIAHVLPPNL